MLQLTRGQKTKLADLTPATQLRATIAATAPGLQFDFSCFGVDSAGQLSDDRYFVFFNQKTSPEAAISMSGNGDFSVDLSKIPASIHKLVFVATIDGNGEMRALQSGSFSLQSAGSEVARFEFRGADFGGEKAIMVAEIYRKDVWRLAAVGQGFAGGLAALLKNFGGEEIAEAAPVKTAPQPPVSPPPVARVNPPQPVESATPSVVNLKKADSTFKVDLSKSAGEIVATAQWIDNGDRRSDNDDLDLRAGILFPDGRMSMVTCKNTQSLQKAPYISHDGDVKSASRSKPGQEVMRVNSKIGDFSAGDVAIVFSIYSAVSNGPVSIASLKPKMKLNFGAQTVECELDFLKNASAKLPLVYTYVIGLAIIRNGQIEISPGGQVSKPMSEATPWLEWDEKGEVKVTMNGPMVVKGMVLNGLGKRRYV